MPLCHVPGHGVLVLLLADTVPWLGPVPQTCAFYAHSIQRCTLNCFPENYWENPSCLWELRKVLVGITRQKSIDSFRVALADANNVIWFISPYGLDLTLAKVGE